MQPEGNVFEQLISRMVREAGLAAERRGPELFVVRFDMGGGRFQRVFIRPMGQTGAGHLIVGFISPALKMPPEQMLGQKTANALLRENAKLSYGAWAIEQVDGDDYLVALETQIAQTMQPDEFTASVHAVSRLADAMEKRLGVDAF